MAKPHAPESPKSPEEIAASRDEQMHVPRGQSRARFFIILGLMVFSLVIYVVPREFRTVFQRHNAEDTSYFSWQRPHAGPQAMSSRDFIFERRKFDSVLRVLQLPDMPDFLEDEQLGRMIVLDQLALDAGVDVSDSDLRQILTAGGFIVLSRPSLEVPKGKSPFFVLQLRPFPDPEIYKQVLAHWQSTPTEFQETLRRLMRIQRYESLMALAIQPAPEKIEQSWKERHQEHQFDFVAFEVEAAKTEARTQVPDEAGLRTWYDALDPRRKREAFPADWKQERNGAELLTWKLDDTSDPAALLEKYPRPEGADLEQLAKDYYTQFKNIRYRRSEEKADAPTADERLYLPYDEVADKTRHESRVHAALVDYAIALQGRLKAGETVDLAVEAQTYGLGYLNEQDPKTVAEWTGREDIGDAMLAGSIQRSARADKFVSLVVTAKAIAFGRATTHVDAGPPTFDEIKDKAPEEWIKDHALDIARGKAQSFRDLLAVQAPTTEPQAEPSKIVKADAQSFAAKAQSQTLVPQGTGWIDQAKLGQSAPAEPNDMERFEGELKRSLGPALSSEVDEITGPSLSGDRARLYVVRHSGKRDPPAIAIDPSEYEELKTTVAREQTREVGNRLFGTKALESRYQLAFPGRKAPKEGEGKGDGTQS